MLTAQQAFKVGFLARCVHDGLGPAEILTSVKAAADAFEKHAFLGSIVDKGLDAAKGVAGTGLSYGIPLALAAPPVIGGAIGYGLAKATDLDDTDVGQIKDRELMEEYLRQAERLRRQRQTKDQAKPAARSARPFM